jgi:hypothetical protein
MIIRPELTFRDHQSGAGQVWVEWRSKGVPQLAGAEAPNIPGEECGPLSSALRR